MPDEAPALPPASVISRFDVVAIGASAGGIEAVGTLVPVFPREFPAAILLVQHMAPSHQSLLAGLLGRRCRLRVREAIDGEPLAGGRMYVARPDMHLLVRGGRLAVTNGRLVHFSRPSIDVLFESVAAACDKRAIGVILSGTGTDGADGVRAIKARGGTTIVQDPATAAYPGMPHAARATGCADLVLPLLDIGAAIVDLVMASPGETDG